MDHAYAGLIDRTKKIILTPKTEWPVIDAEPTTIADIYKRHVLILAAIPAIAGALGGLLFGYSFLGVTIRPSLVGVISGALTQYILSLIGVFLLGLIIDALAPTFGGTKNQTQAVKVAAYSYTAAWVAGILGIIPQLAVIGGLLGLYSFYLLYLGLPLLMRSPQDKAVGYIAATIVAAVLLFIVIGAVVGTAGRMFTPSVPLADSSVSGTMTVPGGGTIDLDKLSAAAQQAQAAAGKVAIAEDGTVKGAIEPSALAALLPTTLGSYKRTEISSAGANAGGLGGSHAEARYENGDSNIRLELTDMAAAGALAALGGAMNVQSNRETANGYEKTRTVDGRMINEKWDRTSNQGSYSELVENRFMVLAEGKVGDISELKRAAAAVTPSQLAALAN